MKNENEELLLLIERTINFYSTLVSRKMKVFSFLGKNFMYQIKT
nr:MAG TPA: hypothetical protein [Caudoviricetes sp.]